MCVVAGVGVLPLTAVAAYDAVAQMRRLESTLHIAELSGAHSTVARAAVDHLRIIDKLANRLTRRELQVVQLVAKGLSNRAIADALALSERTVENHNASVFAKVQVKSRSEAARLFADGEDSDTLAGFRVTTLMGYSYESRGREQLALLEESIDEGTDAVHELKIPGGVVFIPTNSIAAVNRSSAHEFGERLPLSQ